MSRAYSVARPVSGANAAAMKYDILSAIGLIGVHGSAREQVSMPRLALLVTARYNWRRSEVSMGQVEMARLWGVSDRTAKREVKFWVEQGFLICCRPGVRGRVAAYRLDLGSVMERSEPFWAAIGSDYADRMSADMARPEADSKIVQLPVKHTNTPIPDPTNPWVAVKQSLSSEQPEVFSSWLAELEYAWASPEYIRITAPSRFVASYVNGHYLELLERTLRAVHPQVRQVSVDAG